MGENQESYIDIGDGQVQINTDGVYGGHYTHRGAFYTINGKFDATKNMGIYVDNDRLYLRCSEEGPVIDLENLVFKGAYDIKMGSTVIGKVAQIGPIVYGYIATSSSFSAGDLTLTGTVSPPVSTRYFLGAFERSATQIGKIGMVKVTNNNGVPKFTLVDYNSLNQSGDDVNEAYGYFYYSANSAYNIG